MPVLPDAPVTQAEFQDFRGEVKAEFATFRGEVQAEFSAVRGEFESLRSEMKDFQARLFARLEDQYQGIKRGFEAVDERFAEMNGRFDDVYSRLGTLETEYTMITAALKRIEGGRSS